jgi:hypothetical protein
LGRALGGFDRPLAGHLAVDDGDMDDGLVTEAIRQVELATRIGSGNHAGATSPHLRQLLQTSSGIHDNEEDGLSWPELPPTSRMAPPPQPTADRLLALLTQLNNRHVSFALLLQTESNNYNCG